jgi:hypothetical protein
MKNPTRDQVQAAYKSAPPAVQDAVMSEQTALFAEKLRTEYDLHIDVAATISSLLGHLLLGLTSPAEFLEELKEKSVDPATATRIMNDINQQIFIPLRDTMRAGESGGAKAAAAPVKAPEAQPVPLTAKPPPKPAPAGMIVHPPLPSAPLPGSTLPGTVTIKPGLPTMSTPAADKVLNQLAPVAPPAPAVTPARPAMPLSRAAPEPPANLPGVIQPKPITPMAATLPAPHPITFALPKVPASPPPVAVVPAPAPKPLTDALRAAGVALLKDHEEVPATPKPPVVAPPMASFKPVAPPPAPAPVAPKPAAPPPATSPSAVPSASTPPTKSYAVDPYREPIEEHEK